MARFAEPLLVTAGQAPDDSRRSWIQVMVPGEKVRNGPYYWTITADDLDAYAGDIRERGNRIPIDYDHPAEGQSTRAAGWFTGQAEVRDGPMLWAEVEWTPKAAQEIRDGEYRFVSPEFSFQQKDPKTGLMTRAKQMLATTLTNRPFMKELGAVTLADLSDDDIADRLGVAAEDLAPFARRILEAHGGASAHTEGDTMSDELKAIAAGLGLAEDATADQIAEAAKTAKATADEAATLKTENDTLKAAAGDKTEVESLREELNTVKAERIAEKKESILAKAVTDRRIDPAAKTVLAEQFGDNIDGLEKVIATYTPKPAGERGTGGDGLDDDDAPDTTAAAKKFRQGDGEYAIAADDESLTLHVKAEKLLADEGKPAGKYSSDDYLNALERAKAA